MWRILSFAFSPFGLKLLLAAGLGFGVYSWHASGIRQAKQQQAAETRTEVLKEDQDRYALEKQKYEERIVDLETHLTELAKARALSTQRIEVIAKQAETQKNEVDLKSDPDVLLAIRQRLRAAATTALAQP